MAPDCHFPVVSGHSVARPMLEPLGVTEDEEKVYRILLGDPQATLVTIRSLTGHGEARLRRLLRSLEGHGLVSRTRRPGAGGFTAAPPAVAIPALAHRRQQELDRLWGIAASLTEEFRRGQEHVRRGFELVEILEDRSAVTQRYLQLHETARAEVLILDPPPYATVTIDTVELETLRRGVAYRTIYHRDALAEPGALAAIEEYVVAGQEARTLSHPPLRMAIVDRETALLPLDYERPAREGALLRSPALLAGLAYLFDVLWEQAVPLVVGMESSVLEGSASPPLDSGDQRILALLAAGLKDEAIARQLDLGLRTVRRRVARLMQTLHAGNRFQLALHAARAGWL